MNISTDAGWQAIEATVAALTPSEREQWNAEFRRISATTLQLYGGTDWLNGMRCCPKCNQQLPLDQFKRRSVAQGRAPSWCKPCIATAERARRQRLKDASIRDLGRHIKAGTSAATTRAVVRNLVQRLGGIDAVADSLAHLWETGMASGSYRDRWAAASLILRVVQAGE